MRYTVCMISLCILMANSPLASAEAINHPDAVTYMNQLWSRSLELLNEKGDPLTRQARFRDLLRANFDTASVARFVLGRYWRDATEQEQREFLNLFEGYVCSVFAVRLSHFGGDAVKMRGSRVDANGIVVSADVRSADSASPLKVDLRLAPDSGTYKITDIIVEGISLMVTERAEFTSFLDRNGGPPGRCPRRDAREDCERSALMVRHPLLRRRPHNLRRSRAAAVAGYFAWLTLRLRFGGALTGSEEIGRAREDPTGATQSRWADCCTPVS